MAGTLAAIVLAVTVAGCAASGRPDLAIAVQPSDIAYAMCVQYRPGAEASCEGLQLPLRESETAYSLCLDYHPGDARPCRKVREAYEADLKAFLGSANPPAATAEPRSEPPEISAGSYRQRYRTAEQMYIATSRDAQTFEAALLVPEVRRRVQAVLGPDLTDEKLQALAAQSKGEAIYWYRYMQGLEQGREQ
jgi:hypothetical protein